jgi:hypothetical protein
MATAQGEQKRKKQKSTAHRRLAVSTVYGYMVDGGHFHSDSLQPRRNSRFGNAVKQVHGLALQYTPKYPIRTVGATLLPVRSLVCLS